MGCESNCCMATGYSVVACQLMWYKVHYPEYFWYVKLKYANKENVIKYRRFAAKEGNILLTPHVNGTAKFSISNRFGEECLQEGLSSLDGIGDKVAQAIENEKNENGDFESYVDFKMRMPKRIATIKVFNVLEKAGALDFSKKRYLNRVREYNQKLYGKG